MILQGEKDLIEREQAAYKLGHMQGTMAHYRKTLGEDTTMSEVRQQAGVEGQYYCDGNMPRVIQFSAGFLHGYFEHDREMTKLHAESKQ